MHGEKYKYDGKKSERIEPSKRLRTTSKFQCRVKKKK